MNREWPQWLAHFSNEDLAFVRRFLLNSGSLKALARDYQVSYPTIRLRLDRLIAKVRLIESSERDTEFERVLRLQYAEGSLTDRAFERLLAAYRRERQTAGEAS